jgi:DNA-binding response OmpR family regulator
MADDAASVLVVEDVPDVRRVLEVTLSRAGYRVQTASSGLEGLERAAAGGPDLVVLDLGLPDLDGTEVCRRLRASSDSYVLMLTGRTEEADLVGGLAVGADGYLTKPFSSRELVARVAAMLRRPRLGAQEAARVFQVGELEVDLDGREVRVSGRPLALTRTEFDLLAVLAGRPSRVVERESLLRDVWRTDWDGSLRLVEVHVSNLRRKLTAAGLAHPQIQTVRGIGYRLVG